MTKNPVGMATDAGIFQKSSIRGFVFFITSHGRWTPDFGNFNKCSAIVCIIDSVRKVPILVLF